jgi:uncharacterized protein (DUF2147 family)
MRRGLCGTVIGRAGQGQRRARASTPSTVGTQILSGLKPIGDGRFRGRAFVPKHVCDRHRPPARRGAMQVQGCVLGGLLCDSERWTRVIS